MRAEADATEPAISRFLDAVIYPLTSRKVWRITSLRIKRPQWDSELNPKRLIALIACVRYPALVLLMGVLAFLPEALYVVFGNQNGPVSPTPSNCSPNGTSQCDYHFHALLAKSLGHSSLSTTQIDTHVARMHLKDLHAQHHPRG